MDFGLSPAQQELSRRVLDFARRELNEGLEAREPLGLPSRELWQACAKFGLLGLPMPAEYGGSGEGLLTTSLAMEALGRGCRDNGLVFSLNAQLWACQMPILHFGTEEQKRAWLPGLVSGAVIGAHAATEPGAGSDVFSLKARALRTAEGYALTGTKSFCTNAPIADLVLAFAAVDRSDEAKPPALSAFLVARGTPGMTQGPSLEKMGLRTSPLGEVAFDDCRLPASARLGPEGAGAAIFNAAMEWERACLFAAHLGAMDRLLDDCISYARERRQFGQPIAKFESVAGRIADMRVSLEAGRMLVHRVGWLKDQGRSAVLEAAMAKLFVSEAHTRAGLDALQLFGGNGYMRGYPVERELRDALAGTLYSGTSEMQRRIIAACLGL